VLFLFSNKKKEGFFLPSSFYIQAAPTNITNINNTRINANPPPFWLTPPLFPWQQVLDKISPRYILCKVYYFGYLLC